MNISMNAVTRRTAMRRTLFLSGGLSLPLPITLRASGFEPFSFIVVSDTHLGRKDNDQAERQWRKTVADLARADGDLVIHLGDVVDGGREEQYAIYLEERAKIGKPVHEIPGNHDPPDLFARHIRPEIDTFLDHKGVRFVLLNNSRTDSHDGFFTESQLGWLDQLLTDAAESGLRILLCIHVPVHPNRHPDRGWFVKPEHGQEKFYEVLDAHHGQVAGVFHGHFHNGIRGWDDRAPAHEVCFPSALYNGKRNLMEQGAPGYNLEEFRPCFTRVTIGTDAIELVCHPIGESEPSESKLWKLVSQLK
tara:strand:- start:1901 stop:2815 length:915 start_codon:yes stop_codon:yes gene_type:complete